MGILLALHSLVLTFCVHCFKQKRLQEIFNITLIIHELFNLMLIKHILYFLIFLYSGVMSHTLWAGERLLATGGVMQIEGSAGGGLTPWALIAGYGTREEIGASAFFYSC